MASNPTASPGPGPQGQPRSPQAPPAMRHADVAVVGAGPAGVAAAVTAARHGLDVVLIDQAHFPRDKCCGDGLTAAALRELEGLGLPASSVASWQAVHEVVLHAPSALRVELDLPPGPGRHSVVAARLDLDAALVALALDNGVEFWPGEACTALGPAEPTPGVSQPDGPLLVTTSTRKLQVKAVVAADGMWSPVRKLCGADHPAGYRGDWHAFRQYFTGASPDARRRQHVWFPSDLLPAYIWSFPLADGRINVGYGLLRGAKLTIGEGAKWADILNRPEVRAVLGPDLVAAGPLRAWPIPARIARATLTALGGRVLFVGDAATAADPMTGEGIGQALLTGRLAADTIARHSGGAPSCTIGVAYRAGVRRELVADHRLALWCSRLLATTRGAEWSLRLVNTNAWTRRNFARWMFEDYPRAVLATPRRWRRGMFRTVSSARTLPGDALHE